MNEISTDINPTDLYERKVSQNTVNNLLFELIPAQGEVVFDVGGGAGDYARILKEQGRRVWGVTVSESEAAMDGRYVESLTDKNVESSDLDLPSDFFHILLISHLPAPMNISERILGRVIHDPKRKVSALVAVPNIANHRCPCRLLTGNA